MMPVAMIPMSSAQPGWTKPHAGVTATRPTIGPTQAPEIDTWPRIASITTHVTSPEAAAACVLINANEAKSLKKVEAEPCYSVSLCRGRSVTWHCWLSQR